MKQHLRMVMGSSAILISLSLFVAAFAGAGADGTAGQKTFESKCAQCHGKDAKGSEKMAKVLKVDLADVNLTGEKATKASAPDLGKIVTEGKKKMPKFKGKLSDDQIKEVVAYVKSLQGGAAGGEKPGKKKK